MDIAAAVGVSHLVPDVEPELVIAQSEDSAQRGRPGAVLASAYSAAFDSRTPASCWVDRYCRATVASMATSRMSSMRPCAPSRIVVGRPRACVNQVLDALKPYTTRSSCWSIWSPLTGSFR